MSIANGTTYYDYPQVQLTDRPTFADFNAAFADIDSKLHGLITGAGTDEHNIQTLQEDMAQAKLDIVEAKGVADDAKTEADANAESITLLQTGLGNTDREVATKLYSVAIAEPYDADHGTYSVGNIVVYNGQRYKCTTAVTVSEPFDADKWTGEDVETVLENINDDLSEIGDSLSADYEVDTDVDIVVGTPFKAPCDGYVYAANLSGDYGISIYGGTSFSGTNGNLMLFLKKGVTVGNLQASSTCKFISLKKSS